MKYQFSSIFQKRWVLTFFLVVVHFSYNIKFWFFCLLSIFRDYQVYFCINIKSMKFHTVFFLSFSKDVPNTTITYVKKEPYFYALKKIELKYCRWSKILVLILILRRILAGLKIMTSQANIIFILKFNQSCNKMG